MFFLATALLSVAAQDGWTPTFDDPTIDTTIHVEEVWLPPWTPTGCDWPDYCANAGQLGTALDIWHMPKGAAEPVSGLSYLMISRAHLTPPIVTRNMLVWIDPSQVALTNIAFGFFHASHVVPIPDEPSLAGVTLYVQAFANVDDVWRESNGATLTLFP